MAERPLVRVGAPVVSAPTLGRPLVTCTACGEVSQERDPTDVGWAMLGYLAHRHAVNVHDGDVDREGWT